jgi:hypothetical protein
VSQSIITTTVHISKVHVQYLQQGRTAVRGRIMEAKSHGRSYPGSKNAHHQDGHYGNPKTGNKFGHHKS